MKLHKVFSLSLALALQVMPLTRLFVVATPAAGSSFAIIATWLGGAAALLGSVDAVSGASSISISPATATVGTAYSGIVQYSGAHASSAKSWQLTKNWNGNQAGCSTAYEIAPGLWLTNAATYLVRIGGTPTASGTYNFTLKIHSGTGCTGGDSDTRSATITISGGSVIAPGITTQPVNQTVTAGGNASFTVVASGTAPLSYRWRQNGTNVAGATAATLALANVAAGQAGSYTVIVSNSVNSVTSNPALLTVNPAPVAPSITTQPVSQSVTAGGNSSFAVVAGGTAPFTYSWRQNGTNLVGATTATLALTGVTVGQAGSYTVVVSNSVNSVTSNPAILTVNVQPIAPSITTQPTGQAITVGGTASFTVGAGGTAPLTYQWRQNGTNLINGNSATLLLTNVTLGQAGDYTVVVSNQVDFATSQPAALTVNPAPVAPSITTQPVSQSVTAGGDVSFTAIVAGTAPFTYQWRRNGTNLIGGTAATLTLTAVTIGQAGSYTVIVGNSVNSVTSSVAILTVNPAAGGDLTRPTVALTSPVAGVVGNSPVTLLGVAADDVGVKTVWYSINGADFNNATGSADWTTWGTPWPVLLTTGTNLIRVFSEDLAGNYSLTNIVSLIYRESTTLSLLVTGDGRVTGATNGQPVQSGRLLKLKAMPGSGAIFSNWVGTVDGTLTYLSSSPTLALPMVAGLEVTANFVSNPFQAVAGKFNGLFYETNGVRIATCGSFSLKLNGLGAYTGTILNDGRRFPVSGRFDAGGKATNTVMRSGTNALNVSWCLDFTGTDQITGMIGHDDWIAELTGDRAVFNRRTNPCTNAGNYTFVLPGTPGATPAPEGNGFGTVYIGGNGVVKLRGSLADKSSLARDMPLSKNGTWPVFIPLASRQGVLISWIHLQDRPTDDFNGLSIWLLPPKSTARYYPSGFEYAQTLAGSHYTPPSSPRGRILPLTNGIALLSGGSLAETYTNSIVFGSGSHVTRAYPHKLTAAFKASSGVFRGTFQVGENHASMALRGVAFQKTTNAFGYVSGKSSNGSLLLQGGTLPEIGGAESNSDD